MYKEYKKQFEPVKAVGKLDEHQEEQKKDDPLEDSDYTDDETPEDPIAAKVKECWSIVRKQRRKYELRPWPTEPLDNKLGWQTIRIFVSSTFTDFHNEREVLVKKVFPELREWLEQRSMRLLECDLRWGIPTSSDTKDTIIACMEEIDSCFEENHGEPFFLNLSGERYGWIPSKEDISDDIRNRYDWISGVSITFMEVMHAAIRRRNPNAAFFLRDSDIINRIPEEHYARFADEDPISVQHLEKYREKIQRFFPKQMFKYKCQYSKVDDSSGREKVILKGFDDFSEKVLNFFKQAIEKKYPHYKDVKDMNMEERENASQMNFMMHKADNVCGRFSEIDLLKRYVENGDYDSLKLSEKDIEEFKNAYTLQKVLDIHSLKEEDIDNYNPILCVFAPPGYGKSALLASFVKKVLQSDDLNYLNIFYHFCGKDGESMRRDTLLWRLLLAMDPSMSKEDKEQLVQLPSDKLIKRLQEMMIKYKETEKQLVIVVDGINELDGGLIWLPPALPPRVTCIVSCSTKEIPTVSGLLLRKSLRLDLPEMGLDYRKNIAKNFFRRYSKVLETDQMDCLVDQQGASNPLWLLTACEELRVFGDYKLIPNKIKSLPENLEGLFSQLLDRLVEEDETGYIEKVLCYIEISPYGLPEDVLKKVLSGPSSPDPIPALVWTNTKRHLKSLIRPHMDQQLMLQFCHKSVSDAVQAKFLKDQASRRVWHEELASYFEFHSQGDPVHLTRQALPHHLLAGGLNKRLVEFYRKNHFMVDPYQQRQHLQQIRCTNIAMPRASRNARYCTFCVFKVNRKCLICGLFTHPAMQKEAWLCHMHQFHGGKTMDKCYICNRILSVNMMKDEAFICVFCQGYHNKCCALT